MVWLVFLCGNYLKNRMGPPPPWFRSHFLLSTLTRGRCAYHTHKKHITFFSQQQTEFQSSGAMHSTRAVIKTGRVTSNQG